MSLPTQAIVDPFDIVKDIHSGFRSSQIVTPMDSFPFQQPKEAFRDRVVITIANPTHTAHNFMRFQELLKCMGRILRPSIGMQNHGL